MGSLRFLKDGLLTRLLRETCKGGLILQHDYKVTLRKGSNGNILILRYRWMGSWGNLRGSQFDLKIFRGFPPVASPFKLSHEHSSRPLLWLNTIGDYHFLSQFWMFERMKIVLGYMRNIKMFSIWTRVSHLKIAIFTVCAQNAVFICIIYTAVTFRTCFIR